MRVFLSTADASGDLHAAALLDALAALDPAVEVFGLGGAQLADSRRFEPIVQQDELAVAGLVEVLGHAPQLLRGWLALRSALEERRPDVCVLIDSPDLNLPLARTAQRAGIPCVYYITPQVWAWRFGRVRKLARRVDHAAVIFPFEAPLLAREGVACTFVGHPLVERLAEFREKLDVDAAAAELGLDLGRPTLGLLPGSRTNELAGNLDAFVGAAEQLRAGLPELQVVLPLAPTLARARPSLPEFVRVARGRAHAVMAVATALVVAPGTATVEAALLGTPMVVAHRLHPISFGIARRVSRVGSSCMVNLIAERGVVPELLQHRADPLGIASAVGPLLRDPGRRQRMRSDLEQVCARLGGPGASKRAAEIVSRHAGASKRAPEIVSRHAGCS